MPAPVAAAIERLSPPVPADPAALVPPEELEERLVIAELLDGKLPGWMKDVHGDCDVTPEQVAPDMDKRLARIMAADKRGVEAEPNRDLLERRSDLL